MVFCNNAAVAADGTVFFSDSSTQHGIEHWKKDFVEDTRTGRLPRLDPDGTVTVVQDGLAFANGVVLAADESFVERLQRGPKWLRRHVTGSPSGCSRNQGTPSGCRRTTTPAPWCAT